MFANISREAVSDLPRRLGPAVADRSFRWYSGSVLKMRAIDKRHRAPSRCRARCFCQALVMLVRSDALPTWSLFGLDPNRTLTQYVHRIWQVQQGLPESSIYSILQTPRRLSVAGHANRSGAIRRRRFTPLENIYLKRPSNVWIRAIARMRGRAVVRHERIGRVSAAGWRLSPTIPRRMACLRIPFSAVVAAPNGGHLGLHRSGLGAHFQDGEVHRFINRARAAGHRHSCARRRAAAMERSGSAAIARSLNVWDGSRIRDPQSDFVHSRRMPACEHLLSSARRNAVDRHHRRA